MMYSLAMYVFFTNHFQSEFKEIAPMLFDWKLQKDHGQVASPLEFKDPISNSSYWLPYISL